MLSRVSFLISMGHHGQQVAMLNMIYHVVK